MKRVLISIFLILICYLGFGQTYPVTQNLGNTATTKVKTNALEGKLIITAFTDTTAANTEGYLKNYDGSLIKTTSPINALWYRVLDSAKWVQILPTGGGSGGTRAWLDGGNYNVFGDGNGNAVFGTLNLNGVKLTTNATTRLILNKAGIQAETANTVPLGVDTVTKDITYSTGGGGGGSSWLLAGNAGTTPLTSFLGTTDSVALRFRVNNQPSGIIQDENSTSGYGKGNTALGQHSLESTTSGVYNTALGLYSLYSNTTGEQNTAVGMQALLSSTGDDNTAIGLNALNATTGDDNTAIGTNSLQFSNGTGLIALGSHAGLNHTTGNRRLYINGVQKTTLLLDTTESIIYGAMDSSASNQRLYLNSKIYAPYIPSGVGDKSVRWNSTTKEFTYADTTSGGGSSTITNGTTAMSGFTNTYIPYNNAGTIGQYAISGTGNVMLSASPTTTGTLTAAIGNFSGLLSAAALFRTNDGTISAPAHSFTSATGAGMYRVTANGTAIGLSLLGESVGYLGYAPAVTANGQGNTFLGYTAGKLNYTSTTNGYNNTFIGGESGQANDAGYQNSFLGSRSGFSNTSGYANTFVGQGAGYSNTTAYGSVYVGWHAGLNVIGSAGFAENVMIGREAGSGAASSAAESNVFVGSQVALNITSGSKNIILGRQAGYTLTTGSFNTISGFVAGGALTTGADNVFLGSLAGYTGTSANATTTGSQNVYLGSEAGSSTTSQLTNSIAIGYQSRVGASNSMTLGNSSITNSIVYGAVQMPNYGAGTATFDASGNITSVSDERLKTAIKPYTSGLKQLLLLKPIQYKWNEKSGNETKETYAGFSAQNVKSAIPYGTGENKDGYLSLQERAIVATLVNAVKEQQQQIEELKREIIKLQNK